MVSIFIEGKEATFLKSLLIHIGKGEIIDSISFENSGGWTNLKNLNNKLLDNQLLGIKNLIIFDADCNNNEGGFEKRSSEIKVILDGIGVGYKIFLFPNNEDDGDYELLLEKSIHIEHSGLLECFEKYEICISKFNTTANPNKYLTPNSKSKIYSYISAFPRSRKEKEKFKNKNDWSFDNKNYWNLDSDYLNNLKVFLTEET